MSRRALLWIAAALVAWGAYLALGDWLHYNANAAWRPWRPVMILGSVGAFLAFWWLMLWTRGRRPTRPTDRSVEEP